MARKTTRYPVKLSSYTCQGRDADGEEVVFGDLLRAGEVVGESAGDDVFPPYGVVVELDGTLWVLPAGNEFPDEDHPLRQLAVRGDH